MSTCHSVGIGGGCGMDCPVFLEGDCENACEFIEYFDNLEKEERTELMVDYELAELYPDVFKETFTDVVARRLLLVKQEVSKYE